MARSLSLALDVLDLIAKASSKSLSISEICKSLKIARSDLISNLILVQENVPSLSFNDDKVSLSDSFERLDADFLFKNAVDKGRVCVVDEIDSTNLEFLRNVEALTEGDTVLAELQTAGRGRRGNSWQSSLGKQVLMSMCSFFPLNSTLNALPLVIGMAVASALERIGFTDIKVKWPNDLYFKEGKVAGILIESVVVQDQVCAVIGIGINVLNDGLVKGYDLERKVACLEDIVQEKPSRNLIALTIINALRNACREYKKDGFIKFKDKWDKYDYLCGKKVRISDNAEEKVGICCGINDEGELLLKSEGNIVAITSGHINFI